MLWQLVAEFHALNHLPAPRIYQAVSRDHEVPHGENRTEPLQRFIYHLYGLYLQVHSDPLIFRVFDRHCIGCVYTPKGNRWEWSHRGRLC